VTRFPCRGLLRGLRQHGGHRGQLPWHSIMPSLVHMLDFRALAKLPVAVLVLASRKSMPMPWSGCVLPMTPRRRHTCAPTFGWRRHTCPTSPSTFRLLSRVGEGDISTLGCGLTGSCSSTFRRYSLEDHLGVTASPQSPLPAGYVTLPVDSRSPPLGLMPPHSRGQGIRSIPPFSFAFQTYAPRTIRDEVHRM
jgi:hypothetical protein